jgi:pyridoxine 5-phosphate synthase
MTERVRLIINIDHVATLRNARGGTIPDPLRAAQIVSQAGGDAITVHLREDQRHIKKQDVIDLKRYLTLPLNLEMAATEEMRAVALEVKPNFVCLVPEKRQELTTEGGLNVASRTAQLKNYIAPIIEAGISVSCFIEPDINQIESAREIGANIVELQTGHYCTLWEKFAANPHESLLETEYHDTIDAFHKAALHAHNMGLCVHAGHGLNYKTVRFNLIYIWLNKTRNRNACFNNRSNVIF